MRKDKVYMSNKKFIKIVLVIASTAVYILSPLVAMAAPVTDTITPTAWQPGSGGFLALAQAGTPLPHVTIASRNTPGTVINPGLDSPEPADGSGNEFSIITIPSVLSTCSSDTPVDIAFSSYTRELQNAQPGNDEYTIVSALVDLSGPTLAGYNQASRSTDGMFSASGSGQTISTTAGNLANIASFVNFEAATFYGGIHYQGTAVLGLPTITLTYDNATCPLSPVVSNANIATTIVSSATATGTVIVNGSSFGATDPNGDTLAYGITAGNGAGYFTIDPGSGNITTTRANVPVGTYVLTVQVSDGNGGTANATVTITVTDSGAILASTGDNPNLVLFVSIGLILSSLIGVCVLRRHKKQSPII